MLVRVTENLADQESECSQMTADDYQEVVEIWKNTKGVNLNSASSKQVFERFLNRNPGLSLVVREKGNVIAAVLCGHDGLRGYIHHLAVVPEYRRKGIARMLIIKCLSALSALGIDRCNILVVNDNHEGEKFWSALGWVERNDAKVMTTHLS